MTRVALLTQWFPPEPEGPNSWAAQQLAERGMKPLIVTGIPNYPAGEVYPGYKATTHRRERQSGLLVQRCPLFPSHSDSALPRIANYVSFAVSSTIFGRRILATADVNFVYCSPAPAGTGALVANLLHGTPYVLWIQDLWPDSIFATGYLSAGVARQAAEQAVTAFTRLLYQRAAHIAVITPGMKELLIERGVPAQRVSVVYNWVDEQVIHPMAGSGALRRSLGIGTDELMIMYAGGHGHAQRLGAWVEAMGTLQHLPGMHLVFIGEGTEREGLMQRAGRLPNVHFLPRVGRAEVVPWIAESDIQVISLADDPLFDITLPSKTQVSLACAKPVIASVRGDLARILAESGAGWSATPEDPGSIAAAIAAAHAEGRDRLRERGLAGRHYYESFMSESAGGDRLAELVRQAAAGRSRL
ncbi:MAG: glycosyltransferase family 4 protein [Candidatus Nanopelagicales bacterium]